MIWTLLGFVVFWVPWILGVLVILGIAAGAVWDRLTWGRWFWDGQP